MVSKEYEVADGTNKCTIKHKSDKLRMPQATASITYQYGRSDLTYCYLNNAITCTTNAQCANTGYNNDYCDRSILFHSLFQQRATAFEWTVKSPSSFPGQDSVATFVARPEEDTMYPGSTIPFGLDSITTMSVALSPATYIAAFNATGTVTGYMLSSGQEIEVNKINQKSKGALPPGDSQKFVIVLERQLTEQITIVTEKFDLLVLYLPYWHQLRESLVALHLLLNKLKNN